MATIIAWSIVNEQGQKDAKLSQAIYGQFINEAETGNPNVTGDDVRRTNTAGNLAVSRQRLAQEIADDADIFDDLKTAFSAGIVDGERDFGNADYISQMKVAGIQMLDKVRNNTADRKELEMYDLMVIERMRMKLIV